MNLDLLIPVLQEIILPLLGMGIGVGVLYGAYRTVNRHLERKHQQQLAGSEGGPTGDEVEQLQHRLAELEERVDFAERMLAQRDQHERLPGGE